MFYSRRRYRCVIQLNLCQGFSEHFDPFQEEQHFKHVLFFCLSTSENSTGQMETPSAWLTQMAAIAVSSSATRKAPLVSGELEILL